MKAFNCGHIPRNCVQCVWMCAINKPLLKPMHRHQKGFITERTTLPSRYCHHLNIKGFDILPGY